MKKVDTLIVGFGLAGLAYAETLRQHNRSFHVIDAAKGGSSLIAAGIYNPTVLKRFNMTWKGQELHAFSLPFYQAIEERLSLKVLHSHPIHKLFGQLSDQNHWMVAADRPGLSHFLSPSIVHTPIEGVHTPFGYAMVDHCGRLDTTALIQGYKASIADDLSTTYFDYDLLKIDANAVSYEGFQAKHIVFCEGYAMVNNPFFDQLPIVGSKGQILIIHAPELKQEAILKGPIFIAPLGNDCYWAGASFEQEDKSRSTTKEAEQWLRDKVERMVKVPYKVVKHIAHIRPTVKDRRPLLGTHKHHPNVHLFNGMGSRGVLTAPTAAKWLFDAINGQHPLPKEVNINRFEKTV